MSAFSGTVLDSGLRRNDQQPNPPSFRRRPESRRFAPDYCWSLPGGLVELGESHLKALVREVKE
ncbi:MAG: NUDIX domain-containing protein, partial [Desulfatiglandaceae bacterium]